MILHREVSPGNFQEMLRDVQQDNRVKQGFPNSLVLRSGYLFHPVDRDGMRRSLCREDPGEYRPYQNDADTGKQS